MEIETKRVHIDLESDSNLISLRKEEAVKTVWIIWIPDVLTFGISKYDNSWLEVWLNNNLILIIEHPLEAFEQEWLNWKQQEMERISPNE